MSSYFATKDEIDAQTARINVNEAIRCLNKAAGASNEERHRAIDAAMELCPTGGALVYCNPDGTSQVIDDDSHSVLFASTGKGKTRRFVFPMVYSEILSGTNIVVNDMKGEIYEMTRNLLAAMDYNVYVLDLRDPANSPDRYNPLGIAWDAWNSSRPDDAILAIRNFGLCVFATDASTRDPFWHKTAMDYFTGLALSMLEKGATRDEFTFESIAAMDTEGMRDALPDLMQHDELWGAGNRCPISRRTAAV